MRKFCLTLLLPSLFAASPARAADDFAGDDMTAIEDELETPPADDAISDTDLTPAAELEREAELAAPANAPAGKAVSGAPPASAPAARPTPDAVATPAGAREPNAVEEYTKREIVREEERPSSTPGEKIFDWSKHQGETEVAHPFADKGLIRIDKDRVYHYRVEEIDSKRAADFHAGPYNPTELANPKDDGPNATYADNYNGGAPSILINYEWQFAHSALGKMGLRAGSGLFFSQGNGHFVTDNGLKPLEVFTFVAFPLNFGLVYRFQFWHRQLFVPYAEGGGTLWAFAETRDDGKRPKFGGSAGAYAAAGLALNLTYFNALSRIALDREYGIHAVYLLAEFRRTQGLTPHYDFAANFLNGGLLMEF